MKTLEELFNEAGWAFKAHETYYQVACPNKAWHKSGTDRKPSCVVWPNIAWAKCYACGLSVSIEQLFEGTGLEVPEFIESDFEVVRENIILDEDILHFRKASILDLKKPAFAHRNWNPACIEDYDLRFDDLNNNMVFPVRSPKLVGAVGRQATGKHVHNYFNFFTGKALGGLDKLTNRPKILVVEGWTCLVNCYKWAADLDYDVVCTFTANITPDHCRMLADTDKIITFGYDQDKAGQKGVQTASHLIDDTIFVRNWANSIGDVGDMTESQFKGIFE